MTTTKTNSNTMTTTSVYVLHHTNSGTPESGEIHGIYTTEDAALQAMEEVLKEEYEVTMDENEEEDFIYMYISEQTLFS